MNFAEPTNQDGYNIEGEQLMSSYPNTYDFMLHLTKEDGQNKKLYNRGYIKKLIREEDADKLKQRVEEKKKKKRKIPSTPSSNQTAPQSNTKKAKPPQMAAPPPLPTNITTSPSMSTSDSTLTKPIDQHDDDDEGEFFM